MKGTIALIGPSGCGKSTFLRCLNRMNDTIDVSPLRAQIGMVFQKPNPFPKSIYQNIAYGPKIHGGPPPKPNWTKWWKPR